MKHNHLLSFCDLANRENLPVTGGFVPRLYDTVCFTANEHPYYWYEEFHEKNPEKWRALRRRITSLVEWTVVHPSVLSLNIDYSFPPRRKEALPSFAGAKVDRSNDVDPIALRAASAMSALSQPRAVGPDGPLSDDELAELLARPVHFSGIINSE